MDTKPQKNERGWYQRLTDKQANVWLTSGTVVVAFVLVFGVFAIAKYGNREIGTAGEAAFFRTKGAPGAVIQPAKAEVWNPGLTEDIKWAANRLAGETRVIVALHPVAGSCIATDAACKAAARTPYMITQDPIPNNGSLSWVVPFSLPAGFYGDNMQITVAAPGSRVGIDSEAFTINVADAAANLTITTSDYLAANVGDPFSATFVASGGTKPYKFKLSGGALPPGIELLPNTLRDCASGSDCLPGDDVIISGTPTKVGSYSFTLQTTDGTGQSGSRDFVITVNDGSGGGGGNDGRINVTNPQAGQVLKIGDSVTITWSAPSSVHNVDILLVEDSSCTDTHCTERATHQYEIAHQVNNTGSKTWTVGSVKDGAAIVLDKYRIDINGETAVGESGLFTITDKARAGADTGASDVIGKAVTVPLGGSVVYGDFTVTYVQNLCGGSKTCTLGGGLVRVAGHNRTDEATMHNGDTHAFLVAGTGGLTVAAQSFLATKAVFNLQ